MSTFRLSSVAAAVLIVASGSVLVRAQSLAEVARKEEERRKAVTEPAKVYTNKDLRPAPPGSAPAAADAKGSKDAAKDAKDTADKDVKDAKDAAGKDGAASKDSGARDQKYWADKMKSLREQLERDKTFADAIQTKINALTTDFVNRDDPAQKRVIELDRQKALAELARLNKAVIDDTKAIADFEEEARRAGVPPGWLR
jgi:hypothetical protein